MFFSKRGVWLVGAGTMAVTASPSVGLVLAGIAGAGKARLWAGVLLLLVLESAEELGKMEAGTWDALWESDVLLV
jgi:hypothetical protein